MSCGGRIREVNPARLGERGRWVLPRRNPSPSGTCVHTWQGRNALGIVGGPVVKECTGCGYTIHPTWVPDVAARPALLAPEAFLQGEAEWVEVTASERLLWQDPPLIRAAVGGDAA